MATEELTYFLNSEDERSRWKAFKWDKVQEKDFVLNFLQKKKDKKSKQGYTDEG